MVRRYRSDPVDPSSIARIADAYRRGPSAGFSQGQYLVIVTADDQRAAIAEACGEREYRARGFDPWISAAPVHMVPCVREADYRARYAEHDKVGRLGPDGWAVPFWWVDGGAALMLLLLAAVDEGLATGFLDVPDRLREGDVLGLPADVEPLGLVTVGHPQPEIPTASVRRGRRSLDEVVHRDRWHGS